MFLSLFAANALKDLFAVDKQSKPGTFFIPPNASNELKHTNHVKTRPLIIICCPFVWIRY